MSGARAPFKQRLKDGLSSETQRSAGERGTPALSAVDFEAQRDDVTHRKRIALERLPELVRQFTDEAQKAGAVVHSAGDAEEARSIIGMIAADYNVKIAVKGKSMAAEEIELTPYLESQGLAVVETDPGGRLYHLFIESGMGITGCTVAVADTGTLVLVSDDDSERRVTTLPPVHVVVLGIETIVPAMDDAAAILKILARTTLQMQPSHVSFITGSSPTEGIKSPHASRVQSAKQVHIVLVDNGRTGMLADPAFREALRCIGCGACSNVCPPFDAVGDAFGYIYNGPIGLVLTPWYHGMDVAAGPQSLCFSCNACETVCPASIPLPRLILDVREQVTRGQKQPLGKRIGMEMLERPGRLGRLSGLGGLLQKPLTKGDSFIGGPFLPGSGWRHLPALAEKPFRDHLHKREQEGAVLAPRQATIPGATAAGLRVAYFPGCITDRFYPSQGGAVVRLLQASGCEVAFPPAQGCCGLLAANAGDRTRAVEMAKQTIEALRGARVDYIVSSSTSCAATMIQEYPHTLAAEPGWAQQAQALATRVIDLTHFLDRYAGLPDGSLRCGPPRVATYHDSCQSFNCFGLSQEGRRLIQRLTGAALVEMSESSVCCGFGGTASFEHPEVAERITERKLNHINDTGAPLVVADNPGCIMHLRGALHAAGSRTQVQHLAEFLAGGLPGSAA